MERGEREERGQMGHLGMNLLIRTYFTSSETDSLDAGSISFTFFQQGSMFWVGEGSVMKCTYKKQNVTLAER